METTAAALPPPSTSLMLMEGRALPELGAFWLMRPWLSSPRAATDMPFGATRTSGRRRQHPRLARLPERARAHGWKQGRNYGLRGSLESEMRARLDELFERHGRRRFSLVGWSLGGLFARELAKVSPDKVRCVISLGSPFAGSPRSTNAWRAYEWASGNKVDNESVPAGLLGSLAEAPAVPTTSMRFAQTASSAVE